MHFSDPPLAFHGWHCVARLGSLFGPRLNPHWPALKKTTYSYSLTHRVKTQYLLFSLLKCAECNDTSLQKALQKFFGATSVIEKRTRHVTPHFEVPQTDRTL